LKDLRGEVISEAVIMTGAEEVREGTMTGR